MHAQTRTATVRRRALTATAVAVAATTIITAAAGSASAWSSATESSAISSAAQPENQPYVIDAFGRTSTGGWGTPWTVTGPAAAFATANGVATTTMPAAGGNYVALAPVGSTDTEVQARLGVAALPVGGNADLYVVGRAIDAASGYRLKVRVQADGTVVPTIIRVDGTAAKTIANGAPTQSLAAGQTLQTRVQVTGTGTTTIRAKVWATGTAEPEAWTLETTDTTANLQAAGDVGFVTYTPALTGGLTVRASDVWAGPTAAVREVSRTVAAPGTYLPDAGTTGVPTGTALKVHQGDLTITTPNTVVDGLDVRGFVTVKASNVTIKNTIVRGRTITAGKALVSVESTGSLTIEDSELYNSTPNWYVDGLKGSGAITARRLNIHDVIDTAHFYGDNKVLEASWLHSNLHYADDPAHSDGSHDDNIQIVKGNNMTFVGNRLEGSYNAAIMITQGLGTVSNVTLDRNYLGGGSCTVNVAESGKGAVKGLTLSGNTFGQDSRKACAVIAPVTTTSVSTLTGNTYTDGTAIVVKKG